MARGTLHSTTKQLHTYTGETLELEGTISVTVNYGGQVKEIELII